VRVAQGLQMVCMGMVFAGEAILDALQIPRTPLVNQLLENRVALLGISMISSSVAQSMATTGAFEIYVNGQVIFSKLKTGRLPTAEEIVISFDRLLLAGQENSLLPPNARMNGGGKSKAQ
jgi:selT/selW/selH-like putative selenoprotein